MMKGAWDQSTTPAAHWQVPSVAGFVVAAWEAHPTQFPILTRMGVWGKFRPYTARGSPKVRVRTRLESMYQLMAADVQSMVYVCHVPIGSLIEW